MNAPHIHAALIKQWLVVASTGRIIGHYTILPDSVKARLVNRKLMRLEIDPVTFAATCVLEDV